MSAHLKYLRYMALHKFWVGYYLIRDYGLLGQALTHDWSKFLPDEWFPYVNYFYGPKRQPWAEVSSYAKSMFFDAAWRESKEGALEAFDMAWNHHQKRQPHHYQYWLLKRDDGTEACLPMPDRYRKEMLADWRGAGRAQGYGDDTPEWYGRNRQRIVLHPETRAWVEAQIGYVEAPDGTPD